MLIREWAAREGVNVQTAWRWCREGTMPVPVTKTPSGTWIVHDPRYETHARIGGEGRVVCYARVSSDGQGKDLQRQADRLKAFAVNLGHPDAQIVTEIGSGVSDRRRKLAKILGDPNVGIIIVEHRDRLARMNCGLVEQALEAQGRRLIVVDDREMDDDLVRDMTEVLTSYCARLYGKRSASRRASMMLKAGEDA